MPELPSDPVALLARVPLFASLPPSQRRTLGTTAKERSYRDGETIVKRGDRGIGFYLLLDGTAHVERGGERVATLGAGAFFGEMALLDDEPRSADVRAAGAVRCLVLSPWEFWSTVGEDPVVLRTLLKETVRRLRATGSVPPAD